MYKISQRDVCVDLSEELAKKKAIIQKVEQVQNGERYVGNPFPRTRYHCHHWCTQKCNTKVKLNRIKVRQRELSNQGFYNKAKKVRNRAIYFTIYTLIEKRRDKRHVHYLFIFNLKSRKSFREGKRSVQLTTRMYKETYIMKKWLSIVYLQFRSR